MDGDYGIRDIVSTGNLSSLVAEGSIAIYGQQETFPKVLSGARVSAILDAIGWPAALRSIDTGYSLIQGFTPDPYGTSDPLTPLQATADAELGQFFFSRDGKATFHDRHHRWLAPNAIACVFGDGSGSSELPYSDVGREGTAVKRIKNDIIITQDGAPSPSRYVVTASITAYGRRSYPLTVPLATAAEAGHMALQIGNWYSQPGERFTQLTTGPTTAAKNRNTIAGALAREIGDRVQVVGRPHGSSVQRKTSRVEGTNVSGTPKKLAVTFQLSPDVANPWY
jgi:hypothetical protein